MDTLSLDPGVFWQRGPPETWQGEEEEADDELHQGITTWEGRSLSLQDSAQVGSDEFGYGYSSYAYGDLDDWADPDMLPSHCGEKRRADSLSGDGFDTPQTPNSPLLQSSALKSRNSGTGSLFFKTKLCVKFKAGTCPYNSTCNFAHGMDELRKPPPGWEDMVGTQDMGVVSGGSSAVPSSADLLRFRRTRRCKKYYSEEGCPYGERCNFLHDDQAKARESNAISLGPTTSSACNGGGNGGNERPSNWKTRMCNKWEMTGHCPFGQKCNFAHGLAELQMYAGAVIEGDAKAAPQATGVSTDTKQAARASTKTLVDGSSIYASTVLMADGLNSNASTLRHKNAQTPSSKSQKQMKILTNWKGPADEISTIYGDWIEEDE